MNRAWIALFLLPFLTSCANERIVERPVPVEVVRVETLPVPQDLLSQCAKQPVPESMTYGEALAAWSKDRSCIDILNTRIDAIRMLGDE